MLCEHNIPIFLIIIIIPSELEPPTTECTVNLQSLGFDDFGCNGVFPGECAIIRIEQETIGVVEEHGPLRMDPETRTQRGIVVTTFDPRTCGIGVWICSFFNS